MADKFTATVTLVSPNFDAEGAEDGLRFHVDIVHVDGIAIPEQLDEDGKTVPARTENAHYPRQFVLHDGEHIGDVVADEIAAIQRTLAREQELASLTGPITL